MHAYEIYQNVSEDLVSQQFIWMRESERELYNTAISTLAEGAKLRPVFVKKKSVADQIAWLHKQLKSKKTNMVAEHLLQAWFMQGQQEMLITFCDAMDIKHDGNGAVEEELPETLDEEKLKSAIDALFDKFPADITSLYLHVFNIQTVDGWENLGSILEQDDRISLN